MAGNYPDAPSNRMLLDRDGTQMYKISALNVITQLTSPQVASVSNETSKTSLSLVQIHGQNESGTLLVFFPEKRDVAGYYLNLGSTGLGSVVLQDAEVSTNTTNGVDGTWAAITKAGYNEPMSPNFRSKIQGISSLGIRAMRFRTSSGAPSYGCYPTVHIYGNPSAGQNPNRLSVWHPSSDAHISGPYYDWGDVPRSSSADRSCRIKNLSASLTAESIQIAFDALTDTAPSVPGQFTISADGGATFLGTVNIGNLSPGGISSVLIVRRNTPANAGLSVWEPRIIGQATSWS